MFKALLQSNYSNILNFKTNSIKKSIKFEMKLIKFEIRLFKFEFTSLIFNNNEIINVVNINFNLFKLNVLDSKIYEIKKLIVNSYLISLSIRYNAFKIFKISSLNSIFFFQFINSLASFLNIRISIFIMKIVKVLKKFFINSKSNYVVTKIDFLKNLTRLFIS